MRVIAGGQRALGDGVAADADVGVPDVVSDPVRAEATVSPLTNPVVTKVRVGNLPP